MAKNESTAVNELIKRMTNMKPLRPDPADDLMFRQPAPAPAPLPRSRSANSTPSAAMTMQGLGPVVQRALAATPPRPPDEVWHTTPAPRTMPVAAPFETGAMPVVAAHGRAQPAHAVGSSMIARPPHASWSAPTRAWFEEAHERLEQVPHQEEWVGTLQLPRRRSARSLATRLIAPMILLAGVGVGVGYFVLDGRGADPLAASASPTAAPAEPAAPAVKAADPAPAPASIPAPMQPAFVDVMIVSAPAGATVTLVDRGKTSFIGTTPISTALDPSRKYELVFSHPSQPTWIESIDPSTTRRVDVRLERAAPAAIVPPKAGRATPAAPRAARPKAAAAPAPAGDGILMISSKPPCEIVIDGKPTGLTTPQREIPLPAGSHKVTLVNKAEAINKTIAVQITADQPTKVIQDLMK
jgi:hypothetical protein